MNNEKETEKGMFYKNEALTEIETLYTNSIIWKEKWKTRYDMLIRNKQAQRAIEEKICEQENTIYTGIESKSYQLFHLLENEYQVGKGRINNLLREICDTNDYIEESFKRLEASEEFFAKERSTTEVIQYYTN